MAAHILRVFKEVVGRPEVAWVNTYEIDYGAEMDAETAKDIADSFIAGESAMHLSFVRFTRVVVSTWEPDSKPYDPAALYTIPYANTLGGAVVAGTPENLDTVLWVKRVPQNGRAGRVFYRGVLVDSDTQENAQRKVGLTESGLTRCTTLVNTFKAALNNGQYGFTAVMVGQSQTEKNYLPAAAGQKQVVEREYGPMHVRSVVDWVVGGATRSKTDYGYFDKP